MAQITQIDVYNGGVVPRNAQNIYKHFYTHELNDLQSLVYEINTITGHTLVSLSVGTDNIIWEKGAFKADVNSKGNIADELLRQYHGAYPPCVLSANACVMNAIYKSDL